MAPRIIRYPPHLSLMESPVQRKYNSCEGKESRLQAPKRRELQGQKGRTVNQDKQEPMTRGRKRQDSAFLVAEKGCGGGASQAGSHTSRKQKQEIEISDGIKGDSVICCLCHHVKLV